MSKWPKLAIVDTNVPITANYGVNLDSIPDDLPFECVSECIEVIMHLVKNGRVALDSDDEIFEEYRRHLKLKGQPGVGDQFMKWIHDNRWKFPDEDRVTITKNGDSYNEFPTHEDLNTFDNSDRKFIAVANAHPKKPPIIEATDSKWWGWKDALSEVGIRVQFLCPEYAEKKYGEKSDS